LGAYEVTLLQLAGGYQVFQTGGGRTTPYLISEIRSTRGEVIFAHSPSAPIPVYDPLYATRMVHMLEGVIIGGTGVGANIGRPAAGKTGTSQKWRDAWFVGFTPDLLAGVWVGNDNDRPMAGVTGGEVPARIWKQFMLVAEKTVSPADFTWFVPEPEAEPEETSAQVATASAGAFEDQPATGDADDGQQPRQAAPDNPPDDPGAARPPPAADRDAQAPTGDETTGSAPSQDAGDDDRQARYYDRGAPRSYPPDEPYQPYIYRPRRTPPPPPPAPDPNGADEDRRYRY
jgi:penicillin-binding protein 1A